PQLAAILHRRLSSALTMRTDQINTAMLQSPAQPVGIVRTVRDHALRLASRSTAALTRHAHRGEGLLDERDFRRGRRGDVHSERYTRAVRHHHKLRTLSTFGFSHTCAPFFAGENIASVKTSS